MIHIVSDAEGMAAAGTRLIGTMLRGRARQTEADMTLVLSGGSTPRRLYEQLAGRSGNGIPWDRVGLFWGDERCVSPDDPRSNYVMAAQAGLLRRHLGSIHRMPGEWTPEDAAAAYEREIRAAFPSGGLPRFDLVLLGLGEDGHTASLFPGSAGLSERTRLVLATDEYEGTRRLTLTLPVLAAARSLLFLVSGEAKAEAVRRVLSRRATGSGERPPARVLLDMISVQKMAGWEHPTVTWVMDRPAASLLESARARLDAESSPR